VTRRSRTGVLGALGVLAAVATLTGCDRPTPLVTAEANGHVVTTNAACYARGGVLRRYPGTTPVLKVANGDRVALDVPRSMADDGWSVTLTTSDRSQTQAIAKVAKNQHHLSFPVPDVGATVTPLLAIVQTGTTTCTLGEKSPDRSGVWVFELNVGPS
jgi:uncharacterized lipoprotein YajG